MTNPNNAIGTVGAYGGRTSVNAFSDNLQIYSGRGVVSGWAVAPDSGMTITFGGDGTTRDVAVAEDTMGNFTTVNNISEAPISVTIPTAPATNPRRDCIIAYVDNPPSVSTTTLDNPGACGLIVVQGTPAALPLPPSDADIRSAITVDGGTGTSAYYVILARVVIAPGTTVITSNMITTGERAKLRVDAIYPVGSIYMSVNATNPGTLFGGTWTQIKDTFLLSAGDTYTAGDTGGEATHTLTKDEMPSHYHSYPVTIDSAAPNPNASEVRLGAAQSYLRDHYTGSAGNGQAHNNMPPYLVVYMWQRTA